MVDDEKLSLGFKVPPDSLSLFFLVNGAEERVIFSPNLKHWELHGDSSHSSINVPNHFDTLVKSFVDQVKERTHI